ncbi:MAG: 1-deoxy-D-xylulose-5-phosphate reductoisomerase, partial [Oscillospiraceae bacterium]|nr:1-deoxy-D-xylulose-5-phosphate reductoisomerase [Oscillospiraceae bacterium]
MINTIVANNPKDPQLTTHHSPLATPKTLRLLGSTGSIGIQTLDVARRLGWPVVGLAAMRNVGVIEQQIREFRPRAAALYDETAAADLRARVADTGTRILAGAEGIAEVAALERSGNDIAAGDIAAGAIVVNAIVGIAGLLPTLAAIEAGYDVALANKETLVAGGEIVMAAAARKGVRLLPIDSEHSAIFQCLQGHSSAEDEPPDNPINRIILTASGGPFFGKTAAELEAVTPEQALRHPNWEMGDKITVDSATMMNKGLEMAEARWLFGLRPEQIDVVIHRESVIHSLVEFADNSQLAQLGLPDMRLPIQYALTWPQRIPSPAPKLDLAEIGRLTFYQPDNEAFPALQIWRRAMALGGLYPAAVDAANEQAVALFLDR